MISRPGFVISNGSPNVPRHQGWGNYVIVIELNYNYVIVIVIGEIWDRVIVIVIVIGEIWKRVIVIVIVIGEM